MTITEILNVVLYACFQQNSGSGTLVTIWYHCTRSPLPLARILAASPSVKL